MKNLERFSIVVLFIVLSVVLVNGKAPEISDEELLDQTEALGAKYFFEETLENGLIKDSQLTGHSSIAATGFGLGAFIVMMERHETSENWNYYTKEEVEEKVRKIVNTLLRIQRKQKVDEGKYGKEGLFYHFILGNDVRASGSEVSTIDTALLFAGLISVGEYFGEDIKIKVSEIVGNANWAYYLKTPENNYFTKEGDNNMFQFTHGWSPESGLFSQTWDRPGDETILISLIASASDVENSDFRNSFASWPRLQRKYGDYEVVNSYFGSLFTYVFAHIWFDFEKLGDDSAYLVPLGENPIVEILPSVNWWENSKSAAGAARQFVIDNSEKYSSYGEDSWGLSAVYKPDGNYKGDYGALPTDRGIAVNDGTIAPYSSISTMPFFKDEDNSILENNKGFRVLRHIYDNYYDGLWGKYGPKDSYNHKGEFSSIYLGIDQGPMILMIENYRSGLLWEEFMKNRNIKKALSQVFEYDVPTSIGKCGGSDVNEDGSVNAFDLSRILNFWGRNCFNFGLWCKGADINRDGIVNSFDLSLVLNNWGRDDCSLIVDKDGDGYPEDLDCRDDNPDVNPGVEEICNGIDDDCSGEIDDGNVCVECVEIEDGMEISEDTLFCKESKQLVNGIKIIGNDITVDCNGATLEGERYKTEIFSLVNVEGVSLKNCNIYDYDVGVSVLNSNNNKLKNIHLSDFGKVGILLKNSHDNAISESSARKANKGIEIEKSNNNRIENNKFLSLWDYGILMVNSNENTIRDNEISFTEWRTGVKLVFSSSNKIIDNKINGNGYRGSWFDRGGIYAAGGELNEIKGNEMDENKRGIYILLSDDAEIAENIIKGSGSYGIYLAGQFMDNDVVDNVIEGSGDYGIYSQGGNLFTGNDISFNKKGIFLWKSEVFSGNNVEGNEEEGLYLYFQNIDAFGNKITNNGIGIEINDVNEAANNVFYDNYFRNQRNVEIVRNWENQWDSNGRGNYWARPDGTGFSEGCSDGDGDGICDSAFVLGENNIDNFPLSKFEGIEI